MPAFGSDISVELDAIAPDDLRDLVKGAIEQHLPPEEYSVLKTAEASEREALHALVGQFVDADQE